MKAIVWTRYGSADGLQLQDVEKPSPEDDEILVKVQATSVTAGDSEMRRLKLPLMLSWPMRLYAGVIRPKRLTILGQELAGIVEEVGRDVQAFKKGDQVFGTTGLRFGAYAEYICLKGNPSEVQGALALKPTNLSYEEAAVVPTAALEALHFLREANIQAGQKVLVFGAGGSIGTFSVQLAKYFGAEVTAVDSTPKMEMLRQIGADHTVDYTKLGCDPKWAVI
jgi:NADPH:quinone reductase-like Zn-dependent oxidoreductase